MPCFSRFVFQTFFEPIFAAALLFRAPVSSPQKLRRLSVVEAVSSELGVGRWRVRVRVGAWELTAGDEGWELGASGCRLASESEGWLPGATDWRRAAIVNSRRGYWGYQLVTSRNPRMQSQFYRPQPRIPTVTSVYGKNRSERSHLLPQRNKKQKLQ